MQNQSVQHFFFFFFFFSFIVKRITLFDNVNKWILLTFNNCQSGTYIRAPRGTLKTFNFVEIL